jgi:hypothetical protein
MKSVELHVNTLRLVGAKKERGLKEMRTARLQAMEETGPRYKRTHVSFHRDQTATNYFRISGNFVGK